MSAPIPMRAQKIDVNVSDPRDCWNTPWYAVEPLIAYLDRKWRIWEPACGEGNIVSCLDSEGFNCYGTDILDGLNFFYGSPIDGFDAIVTNPPWSTKYKFIKRAYHLGKPFAMLVPVSTIGSGDLQYMAGKYGMEILLLNRRVKFTLTSWDHHKISNPQMPVLWLCRGILPYPICYGDIDYGES